MSKYEVKLVNIGEEVDNRIRELEIELKDIRTKMLSTKVSIYVTKTKAILKR